MRIPVTAIKIVITYYFSSNVKISINTPQKFPRNIEKHTQLVVEHTACSHV